MSAGEKVASRNLPTGVPGLDEILGGGQPEYSFNIITGAPGCGKTTLAHQVVFANATVGMRCQGLAVDMLETLEETEGSLPLRWVPSVEVPDVVRDVLGISQVLQPVHTHIFEGNSRRQLLA